MFYPCDVQVFQIRVLCIFGEWAQVDFEPVSIVLDVLTASCSRETNGAQGKYTSCGHFENGMWIMGSPFSIKQSLLWTMQQNASVHHGICCKLYLVHWFGQKTASGTPPKLGWFPVSWWMLFCGRQHSFLAHCKERIETLMRLSPSAGSGSVMPPQQPACFKPIPLWKAVICDAIAMHNL